MSVKLLDHKGEICAQIPKELAQLASSLDLGGWDTKWGCWRFRRGPVAAYQLIKTFKPYITHCDRTITEMATAYHEAGQNKDADNLPDIPGLRDINGNGSWMHQRRGYSFASPLPGAFLCMGMGTGKTRTTLGVLCNRAGAVNVVVCPKSVRDVWPHEIKKHVASADNFEICVPDRGTTVTRVKEADRAMKKAKAMKRPFLLVLNYESFWREAFATWFSREVLIDNLIYDECHRLKSHNGKASQFARRLVKRAGNRLGLTGTLIPHSFVDVFAQYRAVAPDVFGGVFGKFRNKYCEMGGFDGRSVVGVRDGMAFELNQRIESVAYFVGSEVLDLPEEVDMFRTCELGKETRKVYNEMDRELYAEIETGAITVANAMVKVLRLQQLTSGHIKLDDGTVQEYGREKMALCAEVMDDIGVKEPIVVFCRFTRDIQAVHRICSEQGRSCAELSGHRNELAAWQDGEFDVIAVQIQSGKEGIDLTRACYGIYYSIGHSLGDYLQSRRRINRPGQTKPVRYYHLLARNTVDVAIYKALQKKQEIIDYILHGVKDEQNVESLTDNQRLIDEAVRDAMSLGGML